MPQGVITANRLTDGVVVWRTAGGQWNEHLSGAALFEDERSTDSNG
jgi:sulfite reductase (NADPH) hemoprotein beta-component